MINMKKVFKIAAVFFMVLSVHQVIARPNRWKRVSDTHLAHLETKMALNNKIKGYAITMPLGGGGIDPMKIGRKRRSQMKTTSPVASRDDEEEGPVEYDELYYYYIPYQPLYQ